MIECSLHAALEARVYQVRILPNMLICPQAPESSLPWKPACIAACACPFHYLRE